MKIYEKPMAIIEAIEIEDVITASAEIGGEASTSINATEQGLLKTEASADEVILFQW